jgi:hypothetical protein
MYYPKSQIEINLYSNAELLVESTKQAYTGFYFSTYDGKYFSGSEPNKGDNISLVKRNPTLPGSNSENSLPSSLIGANIIDHRFNQGQNLTYSNITNTNPNNPIYTPVFQSPIPTPTEILNGEFTRYIVKKSNENLYYEVSSNNFSESITSPFYISIPLLWSIRGNRGDVLKQNIKRVTLIEQDLKLTGLSIYLKFNYLQFYQGR